ncbi:MAG: 2-oxo acid dehydrogenase subunit E2 [Cyclobacteriaceae bacterium]|nr:2-oxo acid dehydrogenase subunit E2 [Cyclobacteriaceae bacterium]
MAEAVIMPRQGQSVESCIFSEWFFKVGDKVSKGDMLFTYETDKAAFEQEALVDGVLLATFAKEGDEIPVLETIAVIGAEGESIDEFAPGGKATVQTASDPHDEVKEDKAPEIQQPIAEVSAGKDSAISPRAKNLAAKEHVSIEHLKGTGPEGRIIERDVEAAAKNRTKATPLAKSIAAHDHKELPATGTGFGGKIRAADVKQMPSVTLANDFTDKKISNIRKIIAQNMYESLANTAQLTLHTSADARKMLSIRNAMKSKMADGYAYNITINDMVSFATIRALIVNPEINIHFMGDSIRSFSNVHLGFAVDTPRGLMVPTVKNANHLTIEGLSATMKELAGACQKGSVNPESLQGATFTMTNLGGFGIEMFTPVLNPPQAGILGVNTITQQAAQLEGGAFGFIPKIGLSLTFDHRALDGAPAARFLQSVAHHIENLSI